MNKDKKLINTLTALSGEITVRNIEERHLKNGKTCFDMYVEHVVHYTVKCRINFTPDDSFATK